jgi:hypothetical protein
MAKLSFAKFLPDDRVQLKSWPENTFDGWRAGTVLTVYEVHAVIDGGFWVYVVSDDITSRYTTEANLERFENG